MTDPGAVGVVCLDKESLSRIYPGPLHWLRRALSVRTSPCCKRRRPAKSCLGRKGLYWSHAREEQNWQSKTGMNQARRQGSRFF